MVIFCTVLMSSGLWSSHGLVGPFIELELACMEKKRTELEAEVQALKKKIVADLNKMNNVNQLKLDQPLLAAILSR